MRLLILSLLFGFVACQQQIQKYTPDKRVVQLNDSAMRLMQVYSPDSIPPDSNYQKAILLLDKATEIDTNFLNAYSNKLMLQFQYKRYNNALETAIHIKNIKPNSPDSYVTVGILYEKLGDTISSHEYFNSALIKYDNILDTMNATNKMHKYFLMNKAIDLILAGQQAKGNDLLKQLYENTTDKMYKEMFEPFINKSRKEILGFFFNPPKSEQISYPK